MSVSVFPSARNSPQVLVSITWGDSSRFVNSSASQDKRYVIALTSYYIFKQKQISTTHDVPDRQ